MTNKHYLLSKKLYLVKNDIAYKDKSYEEIVNIEYNNRINLSSTVKLDFKIFPFSKTKQIRLTNDETPLYYVVLPEHLSMLKELINNSKKISEILENLPEVAKEKIRISQMITEIKSSNDIEGVVSTRKELQDAVNAQNSSKKVRFKSSINQYYSILNSKKPLINNLERIRELYDEIVSEEISKNDLPDGKLFRNKEVGILDEFGSGYVHIGSYDENEINGNLLKLIEYMNSETESDIIKAIISHYIFEYIHPFYDGNGRLGRYLLSSYLAYKLDSFSALSISDSIKNNKKKYDKSFAEVSNPLNKGEITLFILDMMKIIIKGQKNIKESLLNAKNLMDIAIRYVENEGFNDLEKKIIFIMIQQFLFASRENNISNKEISAIIKDYGRRKIDKSLKDLENKNYVLKVSKNPVAYKLVLDKLPMFE